MLQIDGIVKSFSGLVRELIEHSPFFAEWELGRIDPAKVERFLITFDSLVRSFPSLIALGAARADNEDMRVVLATNLYQESGEGDLRRTHHAIFRKFLATAGIDPGAEPEPDFTKEWRSSLMDYVDAKPGSLAALGVLAAGEFLAQPALTRIFSVIRPLYPDADVEYFTTHLELETDHVREIADFIARQLARGGSIDDLYSGFRFGIKQWRKYFDSLYEHLFANRGQLGGRPDLDAVAAC